MRALKNTVTVSLAALTRALGLVASPAAAKPMIPHGHGGFWGPAAAIGLIGAGIAAQNCVEYQPVYDQFGNIVGRRAVNVCD